MFFRHFAFLIFNCSFVQNHWPSNAVPPKNLSFLFEKGIFFDEQSKRLIIEKNIRAEILVIFRTYDITTQPDLEQRVQRFSTMWALLSLFFLLNFLCHFLSNSSGVKFSWMFFKLTMKFETQRSQHFSQ